MAIKEVLHTDLAPAAVGPYSQAIASNGSLRRLRSRCRIFLQYTKYCCKAVPNQDAKFARKSLSMNRASLPLATPQLRFCADFMHKSTHFTLLSKNKDI